MLTARSWEHSQSWLQAAKAAAHFTKAQNHPWPQPTTTWAVPEIMAPHTASSRAGCKTFHGVLQDKQQNTWKREPHLLPSTELNFLCLNYLANKCKIEEPISPWFGTAEQVPTQPCGGEAQEMHNHPKIFLFSLHWVIFSPVSPTTPLSLPLSGHLTHQAHKNTMRASENLRNPVAIMERNQLDSPGTWKAGEDNIRWGTVPVH